MFDPPCRVVHPQHLPAQFGERVTVLDARVAGEHVDLVEIASSAARVARERGVEPAPLMLAYWRDAAQWAKAHPEDGDAGMWRVENAAARLAADRLHAMGLPVAIAYAEPEA